MIDNGTPCNPVGAGLLQADAAVGALPWGSNRSLGAVPCLRRGHPSERDPASLLREGGRVSGCRLLVEIAGRSMTPGDLLSA